MPYVQPNSTIQLFKGINLDNRYLHTIYFANATAQDTWFTSKVTAALTFSNLMYRRYTSDSVKLEIDATLLLGVTYMRFKNTRTGNKWFYAFVLGTDYVNENTSIVYYEIDVMQTWFIQNGSVRPCMVRREHVSDDTVGLNLEVEPVGSEVYDSDYLTKCNFGGKEIIGQTTGISDTDKHMTQGLFTGCHYYHHSADSQGDGNDIYDDIGDLLGSWKINEQEEDLVDLYTVPAFCLGNNDNITAIHPISTITKPTTYDQYTPKNKKLLTYPYSYLSVTTHMGDGAIYRWEYFDSNTPEFDILGTYIGGGEAIAIPKAYNGQTDNWDSGIVINNFPKNAYAYDAYQAWIASGGTSRLDDSRLVSSVKGAGGVLSAIGGVVSGVLGGSIGGGRESGQDYNKTTTRYNKAGEVIGTSITNAARRGYSVSNAGLNIGSVTGAVSNAVNLAGDLIEARNNLQYQFNDAVYQPNIVVGKQTCNLAMALNEANYYFYHTHVRDDEVKRIDDFFSCYGYAVNKVKTPNLTGRSYWNFVMTENAVIAGDMPSSSKEAIGRIFDSGITFWHNGDNIGNYAQSTSSGSINNPIAS